MAERKRFIQIYTGNGKGKTTAAIGQAVRAAGRGLKTLIIMFMKDFEYGEIIGLKQLSEYITVEQYGNDNFVMEKRPPEEEDINLARKALRRGWEALAGREYDIVILDEICVAVYFKLLRPADLIPILDGKPDGVELILTGRYCPPEWMERADLVTEMKERKHYFLRGVTAREGFES
jgi:cob(I)alamin adenosyltransferase